MKFPPLLPSLLLASALSACGGGLSFGDFDDEEPFFWREPFSSGRPGSVAVSAATQAPFNGTYAATDVRLSDVIGVGAFGGDPATCRFRFGGLQQQGGSDRVMDGEIRYLPDSNALHTALVVINTFEYRLDGSSGVTVDRAANRVSFNGAVLTNTQGFAQTITLTGTLPIRAEGKPSGC